MIGVVAVLFVALRPLENNPLPGWDGVPTITSVRRGTAVGMLLCVAGAAILAAVKWGLKDDGLVCVAVMLTAPAGRPGTGRGATPAGWCGNPRTGPARWAFAPHGRSQSALRRKEHLQRFA